MRTTIIFRVKTAFAMTAKNCCRAFAIHSFLRTIVLIFVLCMTGVSSLQVDIPNLQPDCYSQHGDLNLGMLIRLHVKGTEPALCGKRLYKVARLSYLEAFVYAIKDVNNRSDLLPNITLGFMVLDTCANRVAAVSRALYFLPAPERRRQQQVRHASDDPAAIVENCRDGAPDMDIHGIVGPPSSGDAILVGSLLSGFQIPMISPSATSDELSDKKRYEYFLRMVPPDKYQVQAILDLLLHYNWTYTSLLYTQGEYGLNAAEKFTKGARRADICLAVDKMLPSNLSDGGADDIYAMLLRYYPRARAVVLFLESAHQEALFAAAARARRQSGNGNSGSHNFIWIGSDFMVGKDYGAEQDGAFVMYHSFPRVAEFERYFGGLNPINNAANPWMDSYWAKIHSCSWNLTVENLLLPYCGNFTHFNSWEQHVDTYVAAYIDAVYAYAHALNTTITLRCPEAFANSSLVASCIDQPLLLTLLRNQSFNATSGTIKFDGVGDAIAQFSIRQYMSGRATNGSTTNYLEVGSWLPVGDNKLIMHESAINWSPFTDPSSSSTATGRITEDVPESVCSHACGTKQQIIPTDQVCCWSCGECRANEILVRNRTACEPCAQLTWPDESTQTTCEQLAPRWVQPSQPTGIVLVVTAVLGTLGTVSVMVWYYRHGHEKLIKASSRELSTVILAGMLFAYLTSLLLVVTRPTDAVCVFIRVGFHLSVTLIYAPLMVRTLRIYRIFTGGKKGVKQQRFIGSKSQLVLTALLLVPQALLIIVTCVIAPPEAELRMPLPQQKLVELFCDFSQGGVLPALCYNLCLLAVCAVLGFLTRRLPDNFSESWYIFICVSTTLVLWLVTVPALLTSLYASGRYVLVGTCLVTNAAVTIACLFLPKVYAVYFVEEEAMKLRLVEATRIGTDGGADTDKSPPHTQGK